MNLEKIMKQERIKQGLSQENLAKAAGVSKRAIAYWENGTRKMNLASADQIFKALHKTIVIGEQKRDSTQNTTDGEIMLQLKGTAQEIQQVAQERDIDIGMRCDADGCIEINAGGYRYFHFQCKEGYSYFPMGRKEDWERDIPVESIRFGQKPKEKEGCR